MSENGAENRIVRMHLPLYGGATTEGPERTVELPFVLRKELVEVSPAGELVRVIEAAAERVHPRCPHFGVCGGCQYQMVDYQEQVNIKRVLLYEQLHKAKVDTPPEFVPAHTAEAYGYRNRIRLRIATVDGALRFGYNVRGTTEFLPITTCPISAPNLVPVAEALLSLAATNRDAAHWLNAAAELELFTSHDLARTQLTLFVNPRTKAPQGSFTRMLNALQKWKPEVAGAGAMAFDPRTGPTGRVLAEHGAAGLNYSVGEETYWISRGGFFQVNRFLLPELVQLVTTVGGAPRSGQVAWDLFAGVGLFSRVLARSFAQITAVEAAPTAAVDLGNALRKLGPQHRAVQQTTLDFLRAATVQRERPDLIVLDPPRAGAGVEACELLLKVAAPQLVYVSCDPTTLARDLAVLQAAYRIEHLHLVDLFPQTFHMETVAILSRR